MCCVQPGPGRTTLDACCPSVRNVASCHHIYPRKAMTRKYPHRVPSHPPTSAQRRSHPAEFLLARVRTAHAQCGARVAHRWQLEAQLVSASPPPGEDTVRHGASMGLPAAQ